MNLEILTNGLGGPSMYMLYLAGQGVIPARVSITADTGSENDRLTNDGKRITAQGFWGRYVRPLALKWGIDARFVRSRDENGNELVSLWHDVCASASASAQDIPLYGSEGGQLRQSCTDKWKMRAIKQEARRMGATLLISAIGMHVNEAPRRASGRIIGKRGNFVLFQHGEGKGDDWKAVRWMQHYYPLADLRLSRDIIAEKLRELGIPYLVTSECDHCPHKDGPRWLRTSPEVIDEIAAKEATYNGEFFFTDRRIPLKLAMEQYRQEASQPSLYEPDFGCQSGGYCGL